MQESIIHHPIKLMQEEKPQYRIFSSFRDFTHFGIYAFVDNNDEILYFGKARKETVKERITDHY